MNWRMPSRGEGRPCVAEAKTRLVARARRPPADLETLGGGRMAFLSHNIGERTPWHEFGFKMAERDAELKRVQSLGK